MKLKNKEKKNNLVKNSSAIRETYKYTYENSYFLIILGATINYFNMENNFWAIARASKYRLLYNYDKIYIQMVYS